MLPIAIDVMSGDHEPREYVAGALRALADDPELRAFQSALGKESVRHLSTLVQAMGKCLINNAHRNDDVTALCLGRIEAGDVVLPSDTAAKEAIDTANNHLRAALINDQCDGCLRARLDTCASETCAFGACRELGCAVCTNWRNAVEVMVKLFTPSTAVPRVRLAHAPGR